MREADVPKVMDKVMRNTSELVTNMDFGASAGLDSAMRQLTCPKEIIMLDNTGTFRLPTPVPVINGGRAGQLYSQVPPGYKGDAF